VLWNDDFFEKATALKKNAKKDIWLIGGGEIVSLFLNEGLVDKMILTIVPTVLGDGLPLFPGQTKETHFELMDTTAYSTGLVNLVYRKKR
jgi:dihydrofolate reductase